MWMWCAVCTFSYIAGVGAAAAAMNPLGTRERLQLYSMLQTQASIVSNTFRWTDTTNCQNCIVAVSQFWKEMAGNVLTIQLVGWQTEQTARTSSCFPFPATMATLSAIRMRAPPFHNNRKLSWPAISIPDLEMFISSSNVDKKTIYTF